MSGLLLALLLVPATHGVAAFARASPPEFTPTSQNTKSKPVMYLPFVLPGRLEKAEGVAIGIRDDTAHGRWLLRYEASNGASTTHWLIARDALLFDACQLFSWRWHWFPKLEAAMLVALALCVDDSLGPGAGLAFAAAGACKLAEVIYSDTYGESGRRVRRMVTDQMRRDIEALGPHPRPFSVDGILFTVLRMHVGPEDGMDECFRGLGPKRAEAAAPASAAPDERARTLRFLFFGIFWQAAYKHPTLVPVLQPDRRLGLDIEDILLISLILLAVFLRL